MHSGHHHHHHRIPAPQQQMPTSKHHLTGFVCTILTICFIVALVQSCSGSNYP